ncbi:MAG: glycosyltransferase family 4 protein [Deltaproteobacteria bacterium]|nr:glycosyltransferase family 4 protein [Deltaproteobacteria bacterium]
MKVLHLVKTTRGAGFVLRQIRALRRVGVEIVVALPSTTDGLAPRYAEAGAEVIAADLDFGARAPWRLPAALTRCRQLVAAVRPDVIHSHFVSTTLVARLALGRTHAVPRIFQVPGLLHLEHALFRRLDLATAGPADVWIGCCDAITAAYRRAGIAPERVLRSYYGLELAGFGEAARGGFRRTIGVGATTPLVGMVGYMYRPKWYLGERRGVKGHEDLLEAITLVRAVRPEVRAVIVGGAWDGAEDYERELRRRAGRGVVFTGDLPDTRPVYADLDVAVQPSRSEGLPNATVEALASGCPVVATAVGGLPDVIRDGTTGWLVHPGDPARLADAILEALADRAEAGRRATAGRALVTRLLAVDRTAAEVAALYERLVGRARAADGGDAAAAAPAARRPQGATA